MGAAPAGRNTVDPLETELPRTLDAEDRHAPIVGIGEINRTVRADADIVGAVELLTFEVRSENFAAPVRSLAHEWGVPGLADTAELVVSELVTNAVQASERLKAMADLAAVPTVWVWTTSDGVSLVIHVWDASDQMPVLKDFAAGAENGRGLLLVSALGKDWGTYRTATGKVVWVMITVADP